MWTDTRGKMAAQPSGRSPGSRTGSAAVVLPWWRRIAPAVGLFFLSPLVGEYLLGNISITGIAGVLALAPMYGAGALLIREVVRRAGRGWGTMILLGVAYALFEEGLVTQFLFNPSYHGLDLQNEAYIPALGIGARLTVTVIALHAIWSTSVAIALVEALVPSQRTTPWLGKSGLVVTGIVFLAGSALIAYGEHTEQNFLASAPQLVGTAVVISALIIVAFAVGRRPRPRTAGTVPGPWTVGAASLITSSLLLVGTDAPGWVGVGIALVLFAASTALILRWPHRAAWGDAHRLALAGGALMTYAWIGFPMVPLDGGPDAIDVIGNAVFTAGAVTLLVTAIRRTRKEGASK